MRKVLLVAAAWSLICCGASALGLESFTGFGTSGEVVVGVEVGSIDYDAKVSDTDQESSISATVFRPYLVFGTYEEGLNWDFRVRGLYSTKEENDEVDLDGAEWSIDGLDARYRMGWGWKISSRTTINAMGGFGYINRGLDPADKKVTVGVTDITLQSTETEAFTFELGAELRTSLTDNIGLSASLSGGLPINGRHSSGVPEIERDVHGTLIAEARVGVDYRISEGMLIQAGGVWELDKFENDDSGETVDEEFTIAAGFVALVLQF